MNGKELKREDIEGRTGMWFRWQDKFCVFQIFYSVFIKLYPKESNK